MSLPSNASLGTVVGRLFDEDGRPWRGVVTLRPRAPYLVDPVMKQTVVLSETSAVVRTGLFGPVHLVAVDDPDLAPINWTYLVEFEPTAGSADRSSFDVSVPAASYDPAWASHPATSPAVDLTTTSPVPPDGGVIPPPSGGGGGGGGGGDVLVYDQLVPMGTWVITHNFGRRPAIDVYDDAGELVEPDVSSTPNVATLTFPAPTAGQAVLR